MEKTVRISSCSQVDSHLAPASPSLSLSSSSSATIAPLTAHFGSQLAAQNKRKEKARIAARARRSQEANIIMEMANELHITQEKIRRIDKATIVKLAIDYIKAFEILCRLRGSSSTSSCAGSSSGSEVSNSGEKPTVSNSNSNSIKNNSNNNNNNNSSSSSSSSSSSGYEDSENTSSITITSQQNDSHSNRSIRCANLGTNEISATCCCTCCCFHHLNHTTSSHHQHNRRSSCNSNSSSISSSSSSSRRDNDTCGPLNEASVCITPSIELPKASKHIRSTITTNAKRSTTITTMTTTQLKQFQPPVAAYSAPKLNTGLIFAPKTDDMDSHFLMINEERNGGSALILKPDTEILEEDDLTHLAPQAGDVSISLEAEPLDGIELDTSLFSSGSPPTKKPAPLLFESCYIGTIGTVD